MILSRAVLLAVVSFMVILTKECDLSIYFSADAKSGLVTSPESSKSVSLPLQLEKNQHFLDSMKKIIFNL